MKLKCPVNSGHPIPVNGGQAQGQRWKSAGLRRRGLASHSPSEELGALLGTHRHQEPSALPELPGTGWHAHKPPWLGQGLREKAQGSSWKRAHPVEGLCHLPQEVLGDLDPLVDGQVEVGIREVLLDPPG